MLENLSGTNEVADSFYNSEAEDSVEEQLEADEEIADSPDDVEELADEEAEDLEEDVDGAESVTITREEHAELKDQQLMHADYTKKTQALAGVRKQTEALNSDLTTTIEQLEALLVNEESEEELNELLEDGDTAEYLRRTNLTKAKKKTLAAAKAKQDESLKAVQADENGKLIEVMTEWADPKTGQATQKKDVDTALKYAADVGYTNADLEKLADHKIIRALIDAGKYRELKKSKPTVSKRKTPATKKVNGKKPAQAQKSKSVTELFYGAK